MPLTIRDFSLKVIPFPQNVLSVFVTLYITAKARLIIVFAFHKIDFFPEAQAQPFATEIQNQFSFIFIL
jgi:hypothetical protein